MIYVTGDTHGDINRFKGDRFARLTSEDKLIICGDFGFVMAKEENTADWEYEKSKLDYIGSLPFEILFVDGNHENHDRLSSLPEEERYGGKVHRIRNNIFHLTRGELFTIENKTFFAMGGAYSIDKAVKMSEGKWWQGEQPDDTDYSNAFTNLHKCNDTVDYIITHTCPGAIMTHMGYNPDAHELRLTSYFDDLYRFVNFKNWFFGHFHIDKTVTYKATACHTDVHMLE